MTNITIEKVQFPSGEHQLVGNLYRPTNTGTDLTPAVVVTGTWTSVKEQMADRYAERLAAHGYITLSFDFTGFGESEGEPRDCESPALKATNIHNAITYLTSRPDVDTDRIAALGVCASAGYTTVNAVADSRVKALVLVAPWLHDAGIVESIYGGTEAVAERIAASNQARAVFEQTGQVEYVPACSGTDPSAAMPFEADFYLNPDRGGIPKWPNRFAVKSWTEWLTFDPIALAPRLTIPTLIMHSEDAAVPEGAHKFIDRLTAPNTAIWTTGTQFDFYDNDPTVNNAIQAAASHLADTLGATPLTQPQDRRG